MSDAKRVVGRPFQPGNPGRPKGARSKLGESFLSALHDDFKLNGIEAIAQAREKDPLGYVKVVASLLPQQVEIERAPTEMTDEELAAVISAGRLAEAGADDLTVRH